MATIDLAPHDVEEYYNGYANSTLWPLFHYRIDLTEYERETGRGYERVNERVRRPRGAADRARRPGLGARLSPDPAGRRLRRAGVKNRIGFFLHIPWPPTRLFVSLPYHERLVRTMLAYDLHRLPERRMARKLPALLPQGTGRRGRRGERPDHARRTHDDRPGLSDRHRLRAFHGAGRDRRGAADRSSASCRARATARR